ncbi:hypothetical protein [Amycolatopsis vastitatis]|uniref:hypothetical protein n=1 Tax=Amycolatopsis vastitatis TaxID=1905142 RepID=UPI001177F3A1|nr:hypothetical protein [Amycolatopsis vastitatis]
MTSLGQGDFWNKVLIVAILTVGVPYLVNQMPSMKGLITKGARAASAVTRLSAKTNKIVAYVMLITATVAIAIVVTLPNTPNTSERAAAPPIDPAASSPMMTPNRSLTPSDTNSSVVYPVDSKTYLPPPVPGLTIQKGQTVHFAQESKGETWNCAAGETVASGIEGTKQKASDDPSKPDDWLSFVVPNENICRLIGKIGNGAWKAIGADFAITADTSGTLVLMVNELPPDKCKYPTPPPPPNLTCYKDNAGKIAVVITVSP